MDTFLSEEDKDKLLLSYISKNILITFRSGEGFWLLTDTFYLPVASVPSLNGNDWFTKAFSRPLDILNAKNK